MMYTFKHAFKLKPLIPYIVFFTLIIWVFTYYSLTIYYDIVSDRQSYITNGDSGYLIQTSGCRIPEMYLRGHGIDDCMDYSRTFECKSKWNKALNLCTSNLTSLILNQTVWASLQIKKGDEAFKCYYTPITRPKFKRNNTEIRYDNEVVSGDKIYFVDDITVEDEMVEVTCMLNEDIVYRDYHLFVRPEEKAVRKADTDFSVLVLGVDAVSRVNFHRQMPKSSAALSRLDSVEMMGYNKVADNTFPNLVPVLSGLSVEELRHKCWPADQDYFDRCRFVWDDYRDSNFTTVFAEDSPNIALFNYLKSGFRNAPTDHYLRPMMLRAEDVAGNANIGNVIACIGQRLGLTFLLENALKIARSMADHRYMGFFWSTSLTHDYVEFPRFGDADLGHVLDAFRQSGQLERTVLIVMSDHGMRWGSFRNTYQGRQEDRLPMLQFVLPQRFRAAYPEAVSNLRENAARLTTPYDLHETLVDLIDPAGRLGGREIESRTAAAAAAAAAASPARGVSLFLVVPENRTCQSAGVETGYCACHDVRRTLAVDDADVMAAAAVLVHSINAVLSPHPMCSALALDRIHKAAVEMSQDKSTVKDYELQVTTVPGYAKFEAIVRHSNGRFDMIGSVSRLNLYGLQSACVNEAKLKLLCYCTH